MNFHIIRSKTGVPCLWESGGATMQSQGYAIIITNKHGGAKSALYTSNHQKDHALIPVSVGDHIVELIRINKDETILIFEITAIENNLAAVKPINYFDNGTWGAFLDDNFTDAVQAAREKSEHLYCQEPHFIRTKELKHNV